MLPPEVLFREPPAMIKVPVPIAASLLRLKTPLLNVVSPVKSALALPKVRVPAPVFNNDSEPESTVVEVPVLKLTVKVPAPTP